MRACSRVSGGRWSATSSSHLLRSDAAGVASYMFLRSSVPVTSISPVLGVATRTQATTGPAGGGPTSGTSEFHAGPNPPIQDSRKGIYIQDLRGMEIPGENMFKPGATGPGVNTGAFRSSNIGASAKFAKRAEERKKQQEARNKGKNAAGAGQQQQANGAAPGEQQQQAAPGVGVPPPPPKPDGSQAGAAAAAAARRASAPKPPPGVSPAADEPPITQKGYIRSQDAFADRRAELTETYAGSADARKIFWWEHFWFNYVRYFFTREYMIGKDRFGNRFAVRWYFHRNRHEERKCYRIDPQKSHQPYGALPTDSRQWEAWLRHWRHDPPTPEEEEFARAKTRERMGVHVVGDEEVEDAVVRGFAQTKHAAAVLQELDTDENFNNFLTNTDQRMKDNHPAQEVDRTWTATFVRGDLFYNEEEVEVMRSNLSHVYRDRQWQHLEMKRQQRWRTQKEPVKKPEEGADLFDDGPTMGHRWERLDSGVPFHGGVPDLTTPELEKLRYECDALEEERIALRKELGLTDLGDLREGREPSDKGYAPYQPPPTSQRWKPKVWQEAWGTGGGAQC